MIHRQGLILHAGPVVDGQGRQRILVEVIAPPPASGALAIVLDLSDSCGGLAVPHDKLPRLLAPLPRSWPLFIHRLSDGSSLEDIPQLLNASGQGVTTHLNIGHLVDGSADLSALTGDRRLMRDSQGRGSFLRPVMNSLGDRCLKAGLSSLQVLVLTDGELTDFTPVTIPPAIRLAGIAPEIEPEKQKRWRAVLPGSPLFTLSDPELDEWLQEGFQPSVGQCTILACQGGAMPLDGPVQQWDFSQGPLCFLLDPATASQFALRLQPALLRASGICLTLADAVGTPSEMALARAAAPCQQTSAQLEVLADFSAGTEEFEPIWQSAGDAATLADSGRSWLNASGIPAVFRDHLPSSEKFPDALLCLCRGDPSGPACSQSRVVLLAMRRSRPFFWTARESQFFGCPLEGLSIQYDGRESRWMARCGKGEPKELNPRGSQRIGSFVMQQEESPWVVLFSGDFR